MTVQTAKAYGIGDGSPNSANIAAVREALFDRYTSIMVCARYLAWAGSVVRGRHPELTGDDFRMACCRVYNGGSGALDNPNYDVKYAGNVSNYQRNLAWAHEALGV